MLKVKYEMRLSFKLERRRSVLRGLKIPCFVTSFQVLLFLFRLLSLLFLSSMLSSEGARGVKTEVKTEVKKRLYEALSKVLVKLRALPERPRSSK